MLTVDDTPSPSRHWRRRVRQRTRSLRCLSQVIAGLRDGGGNEESMGARVTVCISAACVVSSFNLEMHIHSTHATGQVVLAIP